MGKKTILTRGAEAVIYLDGKTIIKERISKGYRQPELDKKITKTRTKKEIKLLDKAIKIMNVPRVLNKTNQESSIILEYIPGDKISNKLNEYPLKKQKDVMQKIGLQTAKMHKEDIIHGDLTTSNTLLKGKEVYIIDFGLGFISKRIEDKAVDLHLIKQALEAKHWKKHELLFQEFIKGYQKDYTDSKKVLEQLKKVESRGRYK